MGPHGEQPVRRAGATKRNVTTAVVVVAACIAALIGAGVWSATMTTSDSDAEEPLAPIEVFTFVATGIVYVEPGTSRVVWQDGDGASQDVGSLPWRNPVPQGVKAADLPWGEHRDIVGNPDLDIVAWVQTVDRHRGDMVVVKASTGQILARTPVQAAVGRSVVIASVDEEAVYFATSDPTWGIPDVPDDAVWIWRWALGEAPQLPELLPGRYHNDVSAGVWAVYEATGMTFRELNGETHAYAGDLHTLKTDFGGALSPDGRYWYAAGSSRIVDTATGEAVDIEASAKRAYGWTGSAELTFTRPTLVTCSATSGECGRPFGTPPYGVSLQGVCARFGLACGDGLPVN
ncbi:MAG: hypothetical protein ABWX56_05165 [Mycetocola sp.]